MVTENRKKQTADLYKNITTQYKKMIFPSKQFSRVGYEYLGIVDFREGLGGYLPEWTPEEKVPFLDVVENIIEKCKQVVVNQFKHNLLITIHCQNGGVFYISPLDEIDLPGNKPAEPIEDQVILDILSCIFPAKNQARFLKRQNLSWHAIEIYFTETPKRPIVIHYSVEAPNGFLSFCSNNTNPM